MAGRVAVLFGWLTDKVPGRGAHLRRRAPKHRLSLLYLPKFGGVKKENTITCVAFLRTPALGIHHALREAERGEEVRSGNRESNFRVSQARRQSNENGAARSGSQGLEFCAQFLQRLHPGQAALPVGSGNIEQHGLHAGAGGAQIVHGINIAHVEAALRLG